MWKLFWGVLVFSAGVVVGWTATRQFTPEWVGAIGQWAGAAGTIAAIIGRYTLSGMSLGNGRKILDVKRSAGGRMNSI